MTRKIPQPVAYIEQAAAKHIFGKALITNVYRSVVVETIVARSLGLDWSWCSDDYNAWDFAHRDGVKLEVKQSAALQSWSDQTRRCSSARFDIRERTGRYDGADWIDGQCRWADVYVFAHHSRIDDGADHRDPDQWDFYVAATDRLPIQDTIGLAPLKKIATHCRADDLAEVVRNVSSRAVRDRTAIAQ